MPGTVPRPGGHASGRRAAGAEGGERRRRDVGCRDDALVALCEEGVRKHGATGVAVEVCELRAERASDAARRWRPRLHRPSGQRLPREIHASSRILPEDRIQVRESRSDRHRLDEQAASLLVDAQDGAIIWRRGVAIVHARCYSDDPASLLQGIPLCRDSVPQDDSSQLVLRAKAVHLLRRQLLDAPQLPRHQRPGREELQQHLLVEALDGLRWPGLRCMRQSERLLVSSELLQPRQ
mmetsp:Transcript_103775/g.268602  ORF Transcript_103775/g.268602 Transcript_103775/m.268602 type:complete len:237 (-) Transcript_103775:132-842(-)